ncbi:MAG: DUF4469 domain-containing protein [Treponema sp.]|jgi:hypothetical protein|nr:DUF4469 domain-containing protein [Treponema sp.]
MALDFTVKDIIHKVMAKFIHAFLPGAKKPYNLKAVFQPELDIHGIASKAEVYNIEADPRVIEEGFTAACELIYYLSADGYKIKTPVFNLSIRLPGEYEGAETRLPDGVHPEARLQVSASLRKYIRERVQVEFDGIDQRDGIIAEAVDEHTGQLDEVMTIGNLLTIRGYGLKVEADADHAGQEGLFFDDGATAPVKAEILAVNEPRTLKAIVPASLVVGTDYALKVVTQSSTKGSSGLLKNLREVRSEFKLTAHSA